MKPMKVVYTKKIMGSKRHKRLKEYAINVLFPGYRFIEEAAILKPPGIEGCRIIDVVILNKEEEIEALVECTVSQEMLPAMRKLRDIPIKCRKIILRARRRKNCIREEKIQLMKKHKIEFIEADIDESKW